MGRAAQAVIHLSAIRDNYRLAKGLAPSAQAIAVVKADAYGHGSVEVARYLESEAVAFGVACIEEALELRTSGITKPILLLEGFFTEDELAVVSANNFWTAVHRPEQITWIERAELTHPLNIWLKMDSGMHRLGMAPETYAAEFKRLKASPNVESVVLMSHLACADELESAYTYQQVAAFDQAVAGLDAPHSIANSPATLGWPLLHRDWIRPGLMLYGASPFEGTQENADQLAPAMTLQSEVIAIREISAGDAVGYGASFRADKQMRVGTVAMGYGDGYPRHAVTGTPVMVNGQRTHIIGRVSMDMCGVDLTNIADADVGATVEFWGTNLAVEEVAKHCGTIPYTLLTCVTKRVPRVYR